MKKQQRKNAQDVKVLEAIMETSLKMPAVICVMVMENYGGLNQDGQGHFIENKRNQFYIRCKNKWRYYA